MQFEVKKEFVKEIKEAAFDSAHASTLLVLENEDLLVSYFAGSYEKAPDTSIYLSRRENGVWKEPFKVSDFRGIPMWNPVLFKRLDSSIVLFYKVGNSISDWKTYYQISKDSGKTFSNPILMDNQEEFARGPVKNKPIRLQNKTVVCPASIEGEVWDSFVDLSYDDGITYEASEFVPLRRASYQAEMIHRPYQRTNLYGKGAIQPTLWEDSKEELHMFLRTTSSRIFRSDSKDHGKTWCVAYDTGLPNNNSGIDLVKMEDEGIALVYNPRENLPNYYKGPRTPLTLALSYDNGETFMDILDIEKEEGNYSYPAIVSKGNKLFISYTYNRKTIGLCEVTLLKE